MTDLSALQNAVRELPPCWHMVGPLVVDRHSADFPPKFGPEDAAVEAFLQDAAGECLVGVSDGTMPCLARLTMLEAYLQKAKAVATQFNILLGCQACRLCSTQANQVGDTSVSACKPVADCNPCIPPCPPCISCLQTPGRLWCSQQLAP
jgi:hypothetical protein